MNRYALVFYSNVLSTLVLFPLSFFFQRKERLPPLTFFLLVKFFFVSLCRITFNQTFVNAGIDYSSPTLVSPLRNSTPVFSFLLAVVFRMENLDLRSSKRQIKIIGTSLSIVGALTVALYNGSPIGSSRGTSSMRSFYQSPNLFSTVLLATEINLDLGGLLTAVSSFRCAIWIIVQGGLVREYPAKITIVAFYFLFGTIQCAGISLIFERNQPNAWTIRPDIQLISVILSALIGGVMPFLLDIWYIQKKGLVFVVVFKPLGIVIASITE